MTIYRADIDGLRAIAVGGVVLFHAFPKLLTGGFIGVDVFFVLSGFLITAIICAEAEAGSFSIARFYERRFRRILPALGAIMLFTTLAAVIILPPTELRAYGKSLAGVGLFASNFFFWTDSGYFDTASADKPLLHTWSLAVEEQFYIAWPIIAAALIRRGRRRSLKVFVWATVGLSLLAAEVAVRYAPSQAFYLLPYRAWELGFGALLATGSIPAIRSRVQREIAAWAGLALIIVPMAVYTEQTPFPGFAAVPPCLGALLIIHAGQGVETKVGRILSWRPMLFVGLISYSFYLWHWPLLTLPRIALNRPLDAVEACGAVLAAIGLAALSLRYVERPFRGRGTFAWSKQNVLWASTACCALLAVTGAGLIASNGLHILASPDLIAAERAVASVNPMRASCHADQAGELGSYNKCIVGAQDAVLGYDVLLWGDSHADHLMPGLAKLAVSEGFEARQATVSGCSPITLFFEYGDHPKSCPDIYRIALDEARDQADIDAIVISARWSGILPAMHEKLGRQNVDATAEAFESAMRSMVELAASKAKGAKIIIIGSTPEFAVWPATCFARAEKTGGDQGHCANMTPEDVQWGPVADGVIQKLASDRVSVVLPRSRFCELDTCRSEDDGVILFRDDDHLTKAGSDFVMEQALEKLTFIKGARRELQAPEKVQARDT